MQPPKKIIVIGTGFGGLSAAARLAARGHQVTLFEKRDQLGGRAYQYQVNGFSFDGGPTVITAPYMFDEIWALAGRQRADYFELLPLDPFYRIIEAGGRSFDYYRDPEQTAAEIGKISPADQDGYRRFVAATQKIFAAFHPSTETPFLTFQSMLSIMPQMLQLQAFRSMYNYAGRFVADEFVRRISSFHPLLVGGNPFDTPSIFSLIIQFEREWGVHYARGGTGAIVAAFGRLLNELGATIHCRSEVAEIIIKEGQARGVRLADGSVHGADAIVCNADPVFTHNRLIPAAQQPRLHTARLNLLSQSNSLVVIYFGTDRRYQDAGLRHHNIIIGERYRQHLKAIFKGRALPDDLSLYLHVPTLTDETIAPAGCESFYVLSLVPNLRADIDWAAQHAAYADHILAFLEENYLPDLRRHIVARHMIDPRHFRDTLNSHHGAAFGPRPILTQSGWLRPHNRSDHFQNLYFVGAGTHPGAGVPAVVASGKIAAALIDPTTEKAGQHEPFHV